MSLHNTSKSRQSWAIGRSARWWWYMIISGSTYIEKVHSSACQCRFEWVDGVLTKAIETGQWVLLDNANLCSATVLDRLNPLLEPGGVLLLNECGTSSGQPRILRPHPNFRLILAQDPRQVHINLACLLL